MQDAMAKILGLLRGINRSESGMAVGSTDLTSGSFSHGSHGDAGGAKPVSGAPGSDPYSHGMIPVPALMPSPSLYAIPESRPVSGPVAREPLPQQQLLLPGPSVGHSVGLIPEASTVLVCSYMSYLPHECTLRVGMRQERKGFSVQALFFE